MKNITHKNTKWAQQLIASQEDDGKWGCFHTLHQYYNAPITTEQALRRLERLGFTIEDPCIQKAVYYMNACLIGKKEIPDRRETLVDWNGFTALMLAAWIRRFTDEVPAANRVFEQWKEVISYAFRTGQYDWEHYLSSYRNVFGAEPRGGRLVDFTNFYVVSLVRDGLDERTEKAFLDYVISSGGGIYYIYVRKLLTAPKVFASKQASRYLAAIELLAEYKYAAPKLQFVVDWLNQNRNQNGMWDMGKMVKDKVYFPLSNDWRRAKTREMDCTERIAGLIAQLTRLE